MSSLNSYGVLVGEPKDGPSIGGWHKVVTLERCEQEYKNREVLHIRPKDQTPKAALQTGTLTHIGRGHWFASQFSAHVDDCLNAITTFCKSKGTYTIEAERESIRLTEAYINFWKFQPRPIVKAVEYDVGPAPLKEDDPLFLYRTMRADDVSIYADSLGKPCIGDLKTTSDSISNCVNEYRQNGQFILYSILWKMAKEGVQTLGPVMGIMLDICTKDKDPKFHRELIIVTEFQQRWFYENLRHTLKRAASIDITTPTRRNTTQCARSISRKGSYLCDYHKLCQYGSSAAGQYENSDGQLMSEDGLINLVAI